MIRIRICHTVLIIVIHAFNNKSNTIFLAVCVCLCALGTTCTRICTFAISPAGLGNRSALLGNLGSCRWNLRDFLSKICRAMAQMSSFQCHFNIQFFHELFWYFNSVLLMYTTVVLQSQSLSRLEPGFFGWSRSRTLVTLPFLKLLKSLDAGDENNFLSRESEPDPIKKGPALKP